MSNPPPKPRSYTFAIALIAGVVFVASGVVGLVLWQKKGRPGSAVAAETVVPVPPPEANEAKKDAPPVTAHPKPEPTPETISANAAGSLATGAIRDLRIYDLGRGAKLEMRYVPGGEFKMGSPVEEAGRSGHEGQVEVSLSSHFWMAKTECTQRQWKALTEDNPSRSKGDEQPVEDVSWEDAVKFCEKLNEKVKLPEGWKFALPTEAQWERACRAGTNTIFSFGDTLTSTHANMDGNNPYGVTEEGRYLKQPTRVASYEGNAYGLYDMHGNVSEWCADKWSFELPGGTDPAVSTGAEFVSRGGSWSDDGVDCRSAARNKLDAGVSDNNIGFRVVAVPGGR